MMIALYSVLMLFLNVVKFLIYRRARTLERKYTRLSLETKKLANQSGNRQGNANRNDPYLSAKQQFELGRLVHQRDRIETKYFTWQSRRERFGKLVNAVSGWKGRKLPYLCGILDVSGVLYLINRLGLGTIDFSQLEQLISSLIARQ